MKYIIELYRDLERQGPGGDRYTKQALEVIPGDKSSWNVLDLGCGTGGSSKILAKYLKDVTAMDLLEGFLEVLNNYRKDFGVDNIETIQGNMGDILFLDRKFNLIWCEGAIYNIGFERGLTSWKEHLKDQGWLVVSEIVWTRDEVPEEIERYWRKNYEGMGTVEEKIEAVGRCGYELVNYFVLPEEAWTVNYYEPLEKSLDILESKYGDRIKNLVSETRMEIDLYRRYKDFYSYAFFIMKRAEK